MNTWWWLPSWNAYCELPVTCLYGGNGGQLVSLTLNVSSLVFGRRFFLIIGTLQLCFPWGTIYSVTHPKEHQMGVLKKYSMVVRLAPDLNRNTRNGQSGEHRSRRETTSRDWRWRCGYWSTQPHLPPSFSSSLCPSLHPSIFPLDFFPLSLAWAARAERLWANNSSIHFSLPSARNSIGAGSCLTVTAFAFLVYFCSLELWEFTTSPPPVLLHRLLSLVAGMVQDLRLLSIISSHRRQRAP